MLRMKYPDRYSLLLHEDEQVYDDVWYKLNEVDVTSHDKQSEPFAPLQVKQVLSHK